MAKFIEQLQFTNGLAQAATANYPDVQAFNVQAAPYNAKGDGVTDDTAAIQAAINDALAVNGMVFFPPPSSTYLITSTININGSGTSVRCIRMEGPPNARNHGQIITYNGPSNSSVFVLLGVTDSQFQNIGVCLASGISNVVVWDYQFSATFATTGSYSRHLKCNTIFVNNSNCIWLRLGQNGSSSSGYNVVCDHCLAQDQTASSGTIAVQIGGSQNYSPVFRNCTFLCSCNILCGPIASQTTATVSNGNTTITVADTMLYPASGTISIGGQTAAYTSKSVASGTGNLNLSSAWAGGTFGSGSQCSYSVPGQGVYPGNCTFIFDGGQLAGISMGYDVLILCGGYCTINSLQCQNSSSVPRRFLQVGTTASSAALQVLIHEVYLKNYQPPTDGNGVIWLHFNTILELDKFSALTGNSTPYSSTSNAYLISNATGNGLGRVLLEDCDIFGTFPFVNAGSGAHGTVTYKHVRLTNSAGTPQSVISEEPYAFVAVTATTYNALTSDHTIECNATSNVITVNLPAANSVPPGFEYEIKKTDSSANAVTVTPAGSDKIDGAATFSLATQYKFLVIRSDSSANWRVYGSN